MATTPEGKVKKKVKDILAKFGQHVYGDWPVPAGYGKSTVDYIGHCCGFAFVIETKAEGKAPKPMQELFMRDWCAGGGTAFVIEGLQDPTFRTLEQWLEDIVAYAGHRGGGFVHRNGPEYDLERQK